MAFQLCSLSEFLQVAVNSPSGTLTSQCPTTVRATLYVGRYGSGKLGYRAGPCRHPHRHATSGMQKADALAQVRKVLQPPRRDRGGLGTPTLRHLYPDLGQWRDPSKPCADHSEGCWTGDKFSGHSGHTGRHAGWWRCSWPTPHSLQEAKMRAVECRDS